VNNAGIMGLPKRTLNSQVFELQMATNLFTYRSPYPSDAG
jgi:NAD(P)-dependent dehydrogenase (short-subunit alcohol dehydrogenase family)